MEFSSYKIDDCIREVENCLDILKQKLDEQKNEIENSQKKVANLLNFFFQKENDTVSTVVEPMRFSLPNNSILDSIFKEETQNVFLFSEDREEKRKKLAAERKAEYNTYLEKKEQEFFNKRKVYGEMSTTTNPRSILESVNYETVLAKRKEEELKFRQLNYAEPNLQEKIVNLKETEKPTLKKSNQGRINSNENFPVASPSNPSPSSSGYTRKLNQPIMNSDAKFLITPHRDSSLPKSSPKVSNRPLSSEELHCQRTGGGGEPVRDFLGNIITSRRFRETAPFLQLPSFKQPAFDKNSSYREELAKQIEEKKRLEALEKQKTLELENKIAQRVEEQRKQMQLEYENELQSSNRMKEKAQQERLKQLEEFKKKDANQRQKVKENKIIENKQTDVNEIKTEIRTSSPPVPAVRSKVILEKIVLPIPSAPKILPETPVKAENIFSSLAEIRKKILQERQNFQERESYEVMNRRTIPDVTDEEENYEIRGISEQIKNLKT